MPVDSHKIVKDLDFLNINNSICTKNSELLILVNKKDIRFIISKIMSYNLEDIFLLIYMIYQNGKYVVI